VECVDEIRTKNEEEIKKGVSATAQGAPFKWKTNLEFPNGFWNFGEQTPY